MPKLEERLNSFLEMREFILLEKIGKGFSSEIFLVRSKLGEKFVLKIERDKSPRKEMARREAENLKKANSFGIGPKLIEFDLCQRAILMEFINGTPFGKWVLEHTPKKSALQKCIDSLLAQAQKLDAVGLSHGQLAGKGANILVKSNSEPVIIDFEKASQARKCNNYNQIRAFLFHNPHSAIARRVREILNS
ncbi:MAG: hypothetical protein JW772_01530 [Candidatus Diapherotrites archaeon]|nr:hypothetical protein [Candidatus Diapherotrites archaeon]